MPMSSPIETLADQQYISLSTFRKNGAEVKTPLWFAIDNGKIYVYSAGDSGKIKRLRNSGKATVAACTMKGAVTGEIFPATAVVLSADRGKYVHGLLNAKYTWKKHIFEFFGSIPSKLRLRKASVDGFIEITLD
jgi:uncharacterized protein